MSNSSIWPIDRSLLGTTTMGQSGPGSNGNKGVLFIPQSSSITGASPLDCLVSYPGDTRWGSLTPLQRCSQYILQPQPRYPTKTITDADYADDIAILANTPNQAETLLHSLERATAGIGLYVNAHKTEYMCYNQTGDISSLDGTPLKLVDKFTYLGSSIASTEKDTDTRLTKAWTAINRLSIIWKSDLTDKMKRSFFQAAVAPILLYGCTTWTGEEARRQLHKNAASNLEQVLAATPHKTPTVRPPASYHENYSS